MSLFFDYKHVWVTSDDHFNHINIIKYCNRPWEISEKGVAEMNEHLLNNILTTVPCGDILLSLGDWSMIKHGNKCNRKYLEYVFEKIKSYNIHIATVLGNHDRETNNPNDFFKELGCEKVFDKPVINNDIVFSHEPIREFPDGTKINIHGHIHNLNLGDMIKTSSMFDEAHGDNLKAMDKIFNNINNGYKYINASVEKNEYKPIRLDRIIEKNE